MNHIKETISFSKYFPFTMQFFKWLKVFPDYDYGIGKPQLEEYTTFDRDMPLDERVVPMWHIPNHILQDTEQHKDYLNFALTVHIHSVGTMLWLPQDLNWLYGTDWSNPLVQDITKYYVDDGLPSMRQSKNYNMPLCFAVNKEEQRLKNLHHALCHVLRPNDESDAKPFHHHYTTYRHGKIDNRFATTTFQIFQQMETAISMVWEILSKTKTLFHTPILLFNTINDNNDKPVLHIDVAILESNENNQINYPRIAFDDGQASPLILMARLTLDDKKMICHDGTALLNAVGYNIPNFTQHSNHILNLILKQGVVSQIPILYKHWNVENTSTSSFLEKFYDGQPYSTETANEVRILLNHVVEEQALQLQKDKRFCELNPYIHWFGNYDILNEQQVVDGIHQLFQENQFVLIQPNFKIKFSNKTDQRHIPILNADDELICLKENKFTDLGISPLGYIETPEMYIQMDLLAQFEHDFGFATCSASITDESEDTTFIHPIVLNSPLASFYAKLREGLRNGYDMPPFQLETLSGRERSLQPNTLFINNGKNYDARYMAFIGSAIPFVFCNPQVIPIKGEAHDTNLPNTNTIHNVINAFKNNIANEMHYVSADYLIKELKRELLLTEITLFTILIHAIFGISDLSSIKSFTVQEASNIVQFVIDLTEVRESYIAQSNLSVITKYQNAKQNLYQVKQQLSQFNAEEKVYTHFNCSEETLDVTLFRTFGLFPTVLMNGCLTFHNEQWQDELIWNQLKNWNPFENLCNFNYPP